MATTQNADAPEGPDAASVAAVAAGAIGLALAIGALALFGTRAALSVVAGATIAVANLVTMSAIIRALLRVPDDDATATATAAPGVATATAADAATTEPGATPADAEPDPDAPDHVREGKRGGAAWGAFAVVKIVVLFGGIWVLLTRGLVDPMPLVAGYGVLPLGIAAASLYTSLAPRSRRPARRSGRPNRTK